MPRRRKRASEEAPVSFFSFQDIICCVAGILVLITMMLALDLINRTGINGKDHEIQFAEMRTKIAKARDRQDELNKRLASAKETFFKATASVGALPQDIPVLEEQVRIAELQAAKLKSTLEQKASLRDELQMEFEGLKESSQTEAQRLEEIKKKVTTEKERPDVPAPGGIPSKMTPVYVEFSPSEVRIGQLSATGKPLLVQRLPSYSSFLKWAGNRKSSEDFFVLLVKPDYIADFAKLRFELRKLGFQVGWDAVLPDYSFIKSSEKKEKE